MYATFFRPRGAIPRQRATAGYVRPMGDPRQRTPFYGALMMLAAMISGL